MNFLKEINTHEHIYKQIPYTRDLSSLGLQVLEERWKPHEQRRNVLFSEKVLKGTHLDGTYVFTVDSATTKRKWNSPHKHWRILSCKKVASATVPEITVESAGSITATSGYIPMTWTVGEKVFLVGYGDGEITGIYSRYQSPEGVQIDGKRLVNVNKQASILMTG